MSDRYMTVVAMLDDPDTMLCVLRELRRRFGAWPEAASLYATPWREVVVTIRGVTTAHHALSRLPGVFAPTGLRHPRWPPAQVLARVEQDENGWGLTITGGNEYGPFDTLDEAKQEAERLLLESGEVTYLLTELPWTPEDDMVWPIPTSAHEAP